MFLYVIIYYIIELEVNFLSVKDWLIENIGKIESEIKELRIDEELVGQTEEVSSPPRQIWRIGEVRREKIPDGILCIMSSPKTEIVEPNHIFIKFVCDWEQWYEDRSFTLIDPYLSDIAREFVERECLYLTSKLMEEANEFLSAGSEITGQDVRKVQNKLGGRVDTLVVHPALRLISENVLLDRLGFSKEKHFAGFFGSLKVYWNPCILEDVALIYKKSHIRLRRTQTKIFFDDYVSPKELYLQQDRLVWSIDKRTIGKICVKQ